MIQNINNLFNTYLNVPQDQGNLFLKIDIFKNNILYKHYDTKTLNTEDFYIVLIFNGESWFKLPLNGLINTTAIKKIALKHEKNQ
jgi:hypothetical protein